MSEYVQISQIVFVFILKKTYFSPKRCKKSQFSTQNKEKGSVIDYVKCMLFLRISIYVSIVSFLTCIKTTAQKAGEI